MEKFMQHDRKSNSKARQTRARFTLVYLAAAALILTVLPSSAIAQLNQSDNTGTNTIDPIGPVIESDRSPTVPPTAAIGQRLSDELKQAYDDCLASQTAAENLPRRFARGSADPSAPPCISTECVELERKTQEVREFLNGLDRAQIQQLREIQTIRLW